VSGGLTLTLPWGVLCSDNKRHTLRDGQVRSTRAYTAAMENVQLIAYGAVRGPRPKYRSVVELRAVCHFPDNRKRDAGNYRKLITDALTGIAYTDDSLVHREVWERAGIDRANPRIELTIRPLPP
jgi:Holliday junction resolvase RusA-like endonuclease